MTDRIMALFQTQGHEHLSWDPKKVVLRLDTPRRTLNILHRAIETDNDKGEMSINLPGLGEVVDVPFIQLSPTTVMLVGNTWTAELTLKESEAASEPG